MRVTYRESITVEYEESFRFEKVIHGKPIFF